MRTDSIYSRLQQTDAKSGTTYFLDLMIFLEETPGDKFGKAAQLVKDVWGFPTSKSSLNDGYLSAVSLWRLGRARAFADATKSSSKLDTEMAQVVAQQSFVLLTNPKLLEEHPEIILGFAKLELDKIKTDAAVRRVKLLEANAAQAKAKLEAVTKKAKGGLSQEARMEIEEAAKLL